MPKPSAHRTALVTGANRGIGLAVAKALASQGLQVLVAARQRRDAERAAESISGEVRPVVLDVAKPASIGALVETLKAKKVHVDVLVNNAGIYPSGGVLDVSPATVREAMEVHFFGPLQLCQALIPRMERAGYGRVVNVSSGYGSIGEGLEGPAAYSLSKAALDALTIKLAAAASQRKVKVNAACPGWVRTRMGGADAELSPEEGADTIVWLATLPDAGPSGAFFRERKPIPW